MIKNSQLKSLAGLSVAVFLFSTQAFAQTQCNRVPYLSGEFNNENSTNVWTMGSGWGYNDASKRINFSLNNTNASSVLSQPITSVPTSSPVTVTFSYRFTEGTETGTTGDSLTVSYDGIPFLNIKTTNGASGIAVFTAENGATVSTSGILTATNDIQVTLTLPAGRIVNADLAFTAYTQNYPGNETNDDIALDNIIVLGDCNPFPCNFSSTAQITSTGFTSGGFSYNTGRLSKLDITTGVITPYFNNYQTDNDGTSDGESFNATGYNLLDGFVYGFLQNAAAGNIFARIDATGAITKFTVPNATNPNNNIGDVTPEGYYYYADQGANRYFCIDLNPAHTTTYLKMVDPLAGFTLDVAPFGTAFSANGLSSGEILIADWAYNPNDGMLYAIYNPTADAAHRFRLMKLNPLTGNITVSALQVASGPPNINTEGSGYGSVLFGPNDYMVVFANDLGRYYKVDINTGAATFLTASTPSNQNDGSRCALAPFVATDFSDLNSFQPGSPVYPQAYAEMLGGDVNADNIPDHTNGVWMGTNVSNDYNSDYRSFSSATASIDTHDDGFTIDGNTPDAQGNPSQQLVIGQSYNFNLSTQSNSIGNAQWGMWFDMNADGDFTDVEDVFQSGTIALTGTAAGTTAFPVTIANTGSMQGRIRFAVTRAVANTFAKADNGDIYLTNGEIEDYYVTYTVPLPVNLTAFKADKQGTDALITWTSVNEKDAKAYTIESSRDGKAFHTIGTVAAKGNEGENNYTFTDKKPEAGAHYYRLKTIEHDQSYSYSAVRLLNFGTVNTILTYPNPARKSITISGLESGMEIRVVTMDGRTLKNVVATSATKELETAQLTPGVYLLQVVSQSAIVNTIRFTKE